MTPLELFFDLVYVFTVSQLSLNLVEEVSLRGMAQTLVLTLAVMYAWFMTVWTSNWLDVERRPVQLMLLGLMFASLLMSTSVADVFGNSSLGDRADLFVIGYLAIQLGRTVFATSAFRDHRSLWWCYFHRAERLGIDAVDGAGDASRVVAIGNYTLIAMVIGIVAIAVGDELAIAGPDLDLTASATALIFGGPAIFLLAQLVFMRGVSGQAPRARIGACLALAVLAVLTAPFSLLVAVIAASAVLLAVAIDDTRAYSED